MHSNPPIDRWWRGPIENRARKWAEEVYRRTRGLKPWPASGGLISAHAKQAIADMLPTDEQGEAMIKYAYETAKARYEELCQRRECDR
jgi:hypothetical protein